ATLTGEAGSRRFGVATTPPGLARRIPARRTILGLQIQYTGSRFTEGDPHVLTAEPCRLRAAIVQAVRLCVEQDGAEAVIIGGGPLGQVAAEVRPIFTLPIIVPIPAAVPRLVGMLAC